MAPGFQDWHDRMTHWSLALQPFYFTVEHPAGRKNVNSDFLSRPENWAWNFLEAAGWGAGCLSMGATQHVERGKSGNPGLPGPPLPVFFLKCTTSVFFGLGLTTLFSWNPISNKANRKMLRTSVGPAFSLYVYKFAIWRPQELLFCDLFLLCWARGTPQLF